MEWDGAVPVPGSAAALRPAQRRGLRSPARLFPRSIIALSALELLPKGQFLSALETTGGHHTKSARSLESITEGTAELTLTDIVGGLGNISGLLGRSEVGSVDIGVGELCDNEGTM